jgi:DNA-binding response OmpR family regulator
MSPTGKTRARNALVLGEAGLVRVVCEQLPATGHAPSVSPVPLSGAGFDLVVLCCDGVLDWGSYVEHQRLSGQLLPILVVGHEGPCSRCDVALNGGADAWIPESPARLFGNMLVRTIRALARRASGPWVAQCSGIRFEPSACVVWFGSERFALRPKEYLLLAYLANRAGSWATEEELREQALGIVQKHETPLVRVHLSALRKSLGAFAACVESRRGFGYRLLAPAPATDPRLGSTTGP